MKPKKRGRELYRVISRPGTIWSMHSCIYMTLGESVKKRELEILVIKEYSKQNYVTCTYFGFIDRVIDGSVTGVRVISA